jgi:poly(A) polymerase
MTGRTPKDFDIGTDARPNEIRRLFRNSRIIGRRFRLAHIFFQGGKIIEVSTFRARPGAVEPADTEEVPDDILIRDDNTFGTPEEDAYRRDFTINGLFYDISNFSVIDYVGGVEDLEARTVRTIGDPEIRFREDPVRMLRACEFAARLDFEMEPRLLEAIETVRGEILKSASPRVTEELLDPVRRGWGASTYRTWSRTGLLDVLIPELEAEAGHRAEHPGPARSYFWRMLENADRRCAEGHAVPDTVILAMLFLPLVIGAVRTRGGGGQRLEAPNLLTVLEDVINPIAIRMSLPNQAVHQAKQALYTMGRLAETSPGEPRAKRLRARLSFFDAATIFSIYSAASNRYRTQAAAWENTGPLGRRPRSPEEEEQE